MAFTLRGFMTLVFAAVALVVFATTVLFGLQISGEMIAVIEPIVGAIGGVGPGVIVDRTGDAWMLLAIAGSLSIPASIVLYMLLGGSDTSAERGSVGSGASLARDPRRRQ